MLGSLTMREQELLQQVRMLPSDKQREVLDFIAQIRTKLGKQAEPDAPTYNASIVEET